MTIFLYFSNKSDFVTSSVSHFTLIYFTFSLLGLVCKILIFCNYARWCHKGNYYRRSQAHDHCTVKLFPVISLAYILCICEYGWKRDLSKEKSLACKYKFVLYCITAYVHTILYKLNFIYGKYQEWYVCYIPEITVLFFFSPSSHNSLLFLLNTMQLTQLKLIKHNVQPTPSTSNPRNLPTIQLSDAELYYRFLHFTSLCGHHVNVDGSGNDKFMLNFRIPSPDQK
jgi:hypothetical protein